MLTCEKCGSTELEIKRDSRGLPDAFCKSCGAHIKKMSTTEVLDYYEALPPASAPTDKLPCKYCSEQYVMRMGSRQTRIMEVPIENEYCPMCGRKLTEEDTQYRKMR